MSLSIDDEIHGPAVVVRLSGQLDTLTAKPFESHLAERIGQSQKRIIVDLAEVSYVSSYGLRVFCSPPSNYARTAAPSSFVG